MPILLTVIVILLLSGIILTYHLRKEKIKKKLYPGQKDLLLELIKDISASRIDIILSKEGPEDSSVTLTLFGAKEFIDNGRELSNERYNEFNLFFTDDSDQILDFKKYLGNKYLPHEISEELRNFYNRNYTKENPRGLFFIIITETEQYDKTKESSEGLLSGDGKAFTSWLTFRESCHNLHFLIEQWFKENADLQEVGISTAMELLT